MKTLMALLTGIMLIPIGYAKDDLTGSWVNTTSEGSGFVVDDAPEGFVIYWFTYAPFKEDEQQWFLSVQRPNEDIMDIYLPQGEWMSTYEPGEPIGQMFFDPVDSNTAVLTWKFTDFGPCAPVMVSPVWPWCDMQLEVSRLTRRVEQDE